MLLWLSALSLVRGQLYTESSTVSYAPTNDRELGETVAASGDTVVVGDGGHAGTHAYETNKSPAYVFARGVSGWTLQQTVTATGNCNVAIDGDTLAAGGNVYVRSGGTWTLQYEAWAENVDVAVQGDTVVVGRPYDRSQAYGYVEVLVRSGATWTRQAMFSSSSGELEEFGNRVALDGDTLIASTSLVGSPGPGRAYIYVRNGTTWTAQAVLSLPGGGTTLDVAVQGNTAVVSDPAHNRVGIFTRSGTSWTLAQTISQAPDGSSNFSFGGSVSLNGDVLAVGAGSVFYLYTHTSSGWVLSQTINGSLGPDLALANGGTVFVVGQPANYNSPNPVSGSATIYSVPAPPAPGSGWRDYDVGAVGVAGNSSNDGTTVTVRGSGADIWDRADQFHFRSETLTGDGSIIARVTSAGSSHPWAKAGLMFRESIAPSARSVLALVSPGAHLGTAVRATMGDFTTWQDAGWAAAPVWLKLVRAGNLFTSYASPDGNAWSSIGSASVVMPATIHVGLAVSSHDNAALDTATFTNVQLSRSGSASAPPAPATIAVTASGPNSLTVNWPDADNTETGFEVERAVSSGGFSLVATLAANTTQYADSGLVAGTTYSYRVRAFNAIGASGYSPVASAQATGSSSSSWTGQDIGNTGSVGSQSGIPPTVTMNAGGADIYGNADSFRALYTASTGDTTVVARVASMTNTHAWAKAGVMMRASLSPDAPNVAMLLTASNVCVFQARTSAGADTSTTSGGWFNAPYWVKLMRVGNTFTGYISPDGVTWQLVGTQDIVMPAQVTVALAGSSHTTAAQTVISFSNIAVTGGSTALAAPSHLVSSNVTANGAHLTWTDHSSDEDGFRIYAEDDTPHRGFVLVGSTAANVTSVDIGLQSNDHYYVVVASVRGTTESWSDAITVSTPPSPDAPPATPPHIAVDPDAPNSLRVSWEDVSTTETGFEIERSTGGSPFALVGTSGANVPAYSDAGLTAGTTYSYRVRAMNGTHASGYSPIGSSTAVARPNAPINLTLNGPTVTTLHLSWTDTSSNETGFQLRRSTAGVADVYFQLAPNTTSYTDAGLVAGTTYSYVIHAYTSFASADSNTVTGSTTGGGTPPPPSDWTGRDIGTGSAMGSNSGLPPAFTMNAGGADIYGTADGFRSMFRTGTGDLTVVARVASMTNTHPWAKAGVMIRASLGPDAPNAAMLLTASNVCVFQARTSAGADTTSTSGGWFNAPYWVKLTRMGNTFRGYISPDGTTWQLIDTQEIAMPAQVYVGVAGSSHNPGAMTTIAFDNVVVGNSAPPPPSPVAWTRVAWNSASSSAQVHEGGDAIIIRSMSGDIWDRSDSATFMYRPVTSDDMLAVRVDLVTVADSYSKAGLMFRGRLDAFSENVCVVVTANNGIFFSVRKSAGDVTTVVREVPGL